MYTESYPSVAKLACLIDAQKPPEFANSLHSILGIIQNNNEQELSNGNSSAFFINLVTDALIEYISEDAITSQATGHVQYKKAIQQIGEQIKDFHNRKNLPEYTKHVLTSLQYTTQYLTEFQLKDLEQMLNSLPAEVLYKVQAEMTTKLCS